MDAISRVCAGLRVTSVKVLALVMGLVACTGVSAQNDATVYQYDTLGRLVKVTDPDGGERAFRYDPAGNREEEISVAAGGSGGGSTPTDLRIEAEDMTSSPSSGGYRTESVSTASGGVVMNLKGSPANGHTATLSATFSGEAGTYDVFLGYHDEDDGDATLTTSIDGTQVDTFVLDASGLGSNPTATNFLTREVATGVQVSNGDLVEIVGVQGNWDHANVDYIEFIVAGGGGSPSNQAPTVNAGADQSVTLPALASLSGTASDDGLPTPAGLATDWSMVTGPAGGAVTFGDSSAENTTASFSLAGTYVLRLTADDGELTATDDLSVIVSPAPSGGMRIEAESMTSSPSSGGYKTESISTSSGGVVMNLKGGAVNGHTATLSATFTGSTGNYDVFLGYHDEQDGDATLTTRIDGQQIDTFVLGMSGLGSQPSATNFMTKQVGIGVQVTNGDIIEITGVQGNWDHANVDYIEFVSTGSPTNQAPTVNAGSDQTVTLPSTANLTGTASDDGLPSSNLTTAWSFVSGPDSAVSFSDNSALSTTATFPQAGVYVLRLTADDTELSSTDDVTVTVNAASGGGERIEAEDMTSTPSSGGYKTESVSTASGGLVMNLKGGAVNGHTATLSTTFTGDSGTYDITLGYHDEQDGDATLTTSIAGQQIDTFTLDVSGLGTQPSAANFMTRQVGTDVAVNMGDTIEITGVQGNWDHANVDYIEFVSVAAPPPVPAVTLVASNANEGDNILFDVNLSEETTVDVAVDYVVDHPGGTNSASSNDYTAASGTLTIPAGTTTGTVSVSTTEDSSAEQDELIRITVSNPNNATLTDTTRQATIFDDDSSASFWIDDVSATEGGNLTFTVTKAGSTVLTHAVNYATANGTAVAGADYSAVSGTLSFAPSESSKTIIVFTTQETVFETNETLSVNLSNPSSGATLSDAQGIGTINNDDPALDAVNDDADYLVDCCSPVPDKFVNPLNNDSGVNPTITSITQPTGSGVSATLISSSTIRLDITTTTYFGSMTYTITDANGGSDTATIFINIEEND